MKVTVSKKGKESEGEIKRSKRYRVFEELYKTELDYLKDLNLILTDIRTPFLKQQLINENQDRVLFSSLQQMVSLCKDFSVTLQQIYEGWDESTTMIGKKISYYNEYFKIYREYCSKYEQKLEIIKKVRKSPKSEAIEKSLKLQQYESYMIKPIQRPVKYHLLLKEFLKATPQDHEDVPFVTEAMEKYREVNNTNNSFLENLQRNKKVLHLEDKYGIFNDRVLPVILKTFFAKMDGQNYFEIHVLEDQVIFENTKENTCFKIELDGGSFVEPCSDGKYFENRIYLGGNTLSTHLDFKSSQEATKFNRCLKKVIQQLYSREWNKKDLAYEKHQKASKNVFKPSLLTEASFKATIFYPPKPRISVVQVDTKFSELTLKISVPYPNSSHQMVTVGLQQIFILFYRLQQQFPALNGFVIDNNHKFKTFLIEQRIVSLERFLNYVFRSEEILTQNPFLYTEINIQKQLWTFLTSQDYECSCQLCCSLSQSDNLKHYRVILRKSYDQYFENYQTLCKASTFLPDVSKSNNRFKKCVFYALSVQKSISLLLLNQFTELDEKITFIWNYLGRLDYLMLPRPDVYCSHEMQIILPSIEKKEKQLTIKCHLQMTMAEILEIIAKRLEFLFIRDFSLVLCRKSKSGCLIKQKILHGDELVREVNQILAPASYGSEDLIKQNTRMRTNSEFSQKLIQLKQNVKETLSTVMFGHKYCVALFKTIFLDLEIEQNYLEISQKRTERYAQEILYNFKTDPFETSFEATAKFLAIYYLKQQSPQQKIKIFSKDIEKTVKPIVQNAKVVQFFGDDRFLQIMVDFVVKHQKKEPRELNRLMIVLAYQMKVWGQLYVPVSKFDRKVTGLNNSIKSVILSLTGNGDLELTNPENRIWNYYTVPVKEDTYKVCLKQLFVRVNSQWLELDCEVHSSLRYLLEIYKVLRKKFGVASKDQASAEVAQSRVMGSAVF